MRGGRAEQYYVMDEYKEFLERLCGLYKKGLIDLEIITETDLILGKGE